MTTTADDELRQLDEAEIEVAVTRQIAGAPDRGAGSDLRTSGRPNPEAEAIRLLQQRDDPLGRIEAKIEALLEGQNSMANLLGAAQGRGRGRPMDARYQIITDYHAAAVEAVRELAPDNEVLRLGLLGALDGIKRKLERNLALQTNSGDGSDPTKPLRERNRRAKKRAPKASAT